MTGNTAPCYPYDLGSGKTGLFLKLLDNENEIYDSISNVQGHSTTIYVHPLDLSENFEISLKAITHNLGKIDFKLSIKNITYQAISLSTNHNLYIAGFDEDGNFVDYSILYFNSTSIGGLKTTEFNVSSPITDPNQKVDSKQVYSIQEHGLFVLGIFQE